MSCSHLTTNTLLAFSTVCRKAKDFLNPEAAKACHCTLVTQGWPLRQCRAAGTGLCVVFFLTGVFCAPLLWILICSMAIPSFRSADSPEKVGFGIYQDIKDLG